MKWLIPLSALASIATAQAEPPIVVEGPSGAQFQIMDIHSLNKRWLLRVEPYAAATVVGEDGRSRIYLFTCHGEYASAYNTEYQHVPAGSAVAKIEQVACREIGQ